MSFDFVVNYPSELHTHPTVNLVVTLVTIAEVAAGLVFAAWDGWRTRSVIPVTLIVGGTLSALAEPVCSLLGRIQYPSRRDAWPSFSALGTHVPLSVTLAYTLMMGLSGLVLFKQLEAGGGRQAVLKLWVLLMISDVIFQVVTLQLNVFRYYGRNAFEFFGLPLVWVPTDAALCLLPAIAVYAIGRRKWRWYHTIGLLVLCPSSQMLDYAGNCWPAWLVSNSTLPMYVLWIATAASMAMSVAYVLFLAFVAEHMPAIVAAVPRLRSGVYPEPRSQPVVEVAP